MYVWPCRNLQAKNLPHCAKRAQATVAAPQATEALPHLMHTQLNLQHVRLAVIHAHPPTPLLCAMIEGGATAGARLLMHPLHYAPAPPVAPPLQTGGLRIHNSLNQHKASSSL